MKKISVVVPIYNEEENVKELHREICDICEQEKYEYEIIFIDDGSKDRTGESCKQLYPLKYIRLRRNFGQTSAMDAGIKAAQYDYIVTMDGDRQNDPADIPKMIAYLEENDLDVVSGWRKNRKDTVMKRLTSRGANILRGIIVKDHIHDSGCSLKVYKRECFRSISLYGEMHRFIPALLQIKGFNVGEIEVNHRPRTKGVTKYNWKRTFKGFVDMISVWFWNKYSTRPLHMMGCIGIISVFSGICCEVWPLIYALTGHKREKNRLYPLLAISFVITGVVFFVLGLMSDVLVKIYYGTQIEEPYCVAEKMDNQ
ncbi:MAG: glycosyltransferase family 2 protein [Eubacterium sp.]|nr:glycosyltransferase family 2 protein [Eubacterium sp.]